MSFRIPAATLAVCLAMPALTAQAMQVFNGQDADRKASMALAFDAKFTPHVAVAINYSSPVWKDSYEAMLDSLKGKNIRLGKNWWTTLDTFMPVEIGGTKVEPGAYYLGLHCDQDGKFSLLILDAGKAMKSGFLPFNEAPWKADYTAPLTLAKDSLKETAANMVIAITMDEKEPTTGRFSIRWGKHEASAPVKFTHAGGKAKEAAGDRDTKKK